MVFDNLVFYMFIHLFVFLGSAGGAEPFKRTVGAHLIRRAFVRGVLHISWQATYTCTYTYIHQYSLYSRSTYTYAHDIPNDTFPIPLRVIHLVG